MSTFQACELQLETVGNNHIYFVFEFAQLSTGLSSVLVFSRNASSMAVPVRRCLPSCHVIDEIACQATKVLAVRRG